MKTTLRTILSVFGWMTYWCIAFIALGFVFMYYGRDWPPLKGILDQLIRML